MKSVLDMGRESQDPEMLGDPGADHPRWSLPLWTLTVLVLLSASILGGFWAVGWVVGWIFDGAEVVYGFRDEPGVDVSRNPLTWEGLRFTLFCLTPPFLCSVLCLLMWRFRPHLGEWRSVWKWPLVGLLVGAVPVVLWLSFAVWLLTG